MRYEEVLKELSSPEVTNDAEIPEADEGAGDLDSDRGRSTANTRKRAEGIEDSLAMLEEEKDEDMREMSKEEHNEANGHDRGAGAGVKDPAAA